MTPLEFRRSIPFVNDHVYLDSAAVSPQPEPVVETLVHYARHCPLNYGVGAFRAARDLKAQVDNARREVARFIGAGSAAEIAFTKNTTEAINLVARGLNFEPGDEIIVSSVDHQSNILPWLWLAETRGVVLKRVDPDETGRISPAAVRNLLTPRTRLVALTHVSNIVGTIQPVEDIAELLRSHQALFLVDAAQSGGRIPINVQEIGCDFMTFCGRKAIGGPQGTGFLWARPERMAELQPVLIGSRAAWIEDEGSWSFAPDPQRLEAGVLNTSGVLGLGTAVSLLHQIGLETVHRHNQRLAEKMVEGLRSIPGVTVHCSGGLAYQAGIVSCTVQGRASTAIASWLDAQADVLVASGTLGSALLLKRLGVGEEGVVRASVHYYNTDEDVDVYLDALREAVAREL